MAEPEWEVIVDDRYDQTTRLEVPGGWLYQAYNADRGTTFTTYVPNPATWQEILMRAAGKLHEGPPTI